MMLVLKDSISLVYAIQWLKSLPNIFESFSVSSLNSEINVERKLGDNRLGEICFVFIFIIVCHSLNRLMPKLLVMLAPFSLTNLEEKVGGTSFYLTIPLCFHSSH